MRNLFTFVFFLVAYSLYGQHEHLEYFKKPLSLEEQQMTEEDVAKKLKKISRKVETINMANRDTQRSLRYDLYRLQYINDIRYYYETVNEIDKITNIEQLPSITYKTSKEAIYITGVFVKKVDSYQRLDYDNYDGTRIGIYYLTKAGKYFTIKETRLMIKASSPQGAVYRSLLKVWHNKHAMILREKQ